MKISMKIRSHKVIVTLDDEMKLSTISHPTLDTTKLISECRILSPPNDLRAALLYMTAVTEASSTFQLHLQQLKKKCIITQLSEFSAKLELQNGIEIEVLVDEYYPMVSKKSYLLTSLI